MKEGPRGSGIKGLRAEPASRWRGGGLWLAGQYDFTLKADLECAADGLTRADVLESILSAQFLRAKNSRSPWRRGRRERLYIIDSFNFEGIPIYSKGVFAND